MRTIQDRKLGYHLWVPHGRRPRHPSTPVMTHEMCFLVSERAHEPSDVGGQYASAVVGDVRRLCRVVVSAEVRRDDFEA